MPIFEIGFLGVRREPRNLSVSRTNARAVHHAFISNEKAAQGGQDLLRAHGGGGQSGAFCPLGPKQKAAAVAQVGHVQRASRMPSSMRPAPSRMRVRPPLIPPRAGWPAGRGPPASPGWLVVVGLWTSFFGYTRANLA